MSIDVETASPPRAVRLLWLEGAPDGDADVLAVELDQAPSGAWMRQLHRELQGTPLAHLHPCLKGHWLEASGLQRRSADAAYLASAIRAASAQLASLRMPPLLAALVIP